MTLNDRMALFDRLLRTHRRGVTTERLMEEAACSRATAWRTLRVMVDERGAPIVSDGKKPCTWSLEEQSPEHGRFELPGLWLGAEELFVLVLADQLLGRSGAGSLVGERVRRFQPRLTKFFDGYAEHLWRIQVQRVQARPVADAVFRVVADSILERRPLAFDYDGRHTGELSARVVSPQRLTHYRDNWYLLAWDDAAQDLRTFAVERIHGPEMADGRARDLSAKELEALRPSSYGIFSGPLVNWAVLRFSAVVARWVRDETWHLEQQLTWLDDGRLELRFPYADLRELLKDVLRHGADVEVVQPPALREAVQDALLAALKGYGRVVEVV